MVLPTEILETLAQSAVAYAGLSALALVVVQLAGVRWQSQMTTGFWLVISWGLGAFMFSLLPIVIYQFTDSSETSIAISSGLLAIFIFVVISSALQRDIRILRSGAKGSARPPAFTMISVGTACYATSLILLANAFAWLPAPGSRWYIAALYAMFIYAIVPLFHLVAAVHKRD